MSNGPVSSFGWAGNTQYLLAGQAQPDRGTYEQLTYLSGVIIDFSAAALQDLTLQGAVTLASANLAPGFGVTLRLIGASTDSLVTHPWGAAVTVPANQQGVFELKSFGVTDANVVAQFIVS